MCTYHKIHPKHPLTKKTYSNNLVDSHHCYSQCYSLKEQPISSTLNPMNKRQIQPILGSTRTHSSAPIQCPKSKCKEDQDCLHNYNRDVQYYNSLTWAMYNRITKARERKQNATSTKCFGTTDPCYDQEPPRIEKDLNNNACGTQEEDIFPIEM